MVSLKGKAGHFTVILCVLHIYDMFSFCETLLILHKSNIRTVFHQTELD